MSSALITGASSGIGRASATALHRAGFALTLVGRRTDALADVARSLASVDGRAPVTVRPGDVGDPDVACGVVDEHVDRFGGIDALVAAAGAWELTATTELDAAGWDATMHVHVRAAALGAGRAAHHMTARGAGRIVLVSSVNAMHSEPGSLAYSAAKAAVSSLARTLAVDLAAAGIVANAVAPGWIDTPMTADELASTTPERMRRVNALGRFGTPEEVADVIRYLVVDAPQFLTGSTIFVDGGQTAMAPLP